MRQSECSNRLLAIMAEADFDCLAHHLEPVDLPLGTSVAEPHQPIDWMYFLEEGVASLIACTADGTQVEAGLIGREGFTMPALALDVDQLPHGSRMQVSGSGFKIRRKHFIRCVVGNPRLTSLMLRFAQCLIIQISYTALANAAYDLDVRLARWLLMMHDRSASDDMAVTHEFLSIMLAVRRPSVTQILHILEGRGLIRAERGWLTIRNRAALEAFAGSAYGVPEAEYHRLIGPFRQPAVMDRMVATL